jgi:4-hydroxyphenylpyruvate dioxygenase-like putative hemolysin
MSNIIIQDLTGNAASILTFKNLKFNCAQHEDGTTEIEFIEESVGTTCNQEIYDSWKAEYNARPDDSYKYERSMAYPSIGNQLDMLWHAIDAGALDTTSDFYTTLAAVKNANPKPE